MFWLTFKTIKVIFECNTKLNCVKQFKGDLSVNKKKLYGNISSYDKNKLQESYDHK